MKSIKSFLKGSSIGLHGFITLVILYGVVDPETNDSGLARFLIFGIFLIFLLILNEYRKTIRRV